MISFPVSVIILMVSITTAITSSEQRCSQDSDAGLAYHNRIEDKEVNLHDNITIWCTFRNFCNVTWFHDGIPLSSPRSILPNNSYVLDTNNTRLSIGDVRPYHRGLYKCIGYNETHNLTTEGYLSITGQDNGLAITNAILSDTVCEGGEIGLSCHGTNYTNISWYHNGEYVEKQGTRLYVGDVTKEDGGEYECLASNATHSVSRTGIVDVYPYPDPQFFLKDCTPSRNITAPLGSDLKITCTHVIGAHNCLFVTFLFKFNDSFDNDFNNTEAWIFLEDHSNLSNSQITIERVSPESSHTSSMFYRTIMTIQNVTKSSYGHYAIRGITVGSIIAPQFDILQITPPAPITVRVEFSYIAVLMVVILSLAALWWRYHLDIRVAIRQVQGRLLHEREKLILDGKIYDIYIACGDSEVNVVLNILQPVLRQQGYSTCLRITDFLPGTDTASEIWACMRASRSCIMVASEELIFTQHSGYLQTELQAAIEIFSARQNAIIPISLKEISDDRLNLYPAVLRHMLSHNKSRFVFTNSDITSAKRFKSSSGWKRMRLALPTPPVKSNRRTTSRYEVADDVINLLESDIPTFDSSDRPVFFIETHDLGTFKEDRVMNRYQIEKL